MINKMLEGAEYSEMFFKKETINKILKNKEKLEKKLKVKLEIKNSEVEISGEQIDIFEAEIVLSAIERSFPINAALLLLDENYMLEDIPIKKITRKNPKLVKSRIIGTKGKTLKLLSELSNCYIALHNNTVSIIGLNDKVKEAASAIRSLILGSKQSNVYKYLEKSREKVFPEDLGLKEE